MNIGAAAAAAGLSAKMIRYYEQAGLIPPAARSSAGYRHYTEQDVQQLRFIRRCRTLGFSLEETGALLTLWRDRHRASADVRRIAADHLSALNERIRQLQEMAGELDLLVRACSSNDAPSCPILNALETPAAAPRDRNEKLSP